MEHVIIDCETGETETVPLTPEEIAENEANTQAIAQAEQASATAQSNEATLRSQADAALTSNRAWLKDGPFTAAGVAAQVKALTKQNNGIIRLLLGELDGTD